MKSIVVVSSVPLDERNGAGMRAIIPYLKLQNFSNVTSIYYTQDDRLALRIGQTTGISTRYQKLSFHWPRPFKLLNIFVAVWRSVSQFNRMEAKNSAFLFFPETIEDVLVALVFRLKVRTLLVWVMDDFPNRSAQFTDFLYRGLFGILYRAASKRAVISEQMKFEYSREFHASASLVLGKTIDIVLPPRNRNSRKNKLSIVYLGSFLGYSAEPIQALAKTLKSNYGESVELCLYGIHPVPASWGPEIGACYRGSLPPLAAKISEELATHDFALLPYSFDNHTQEMMRLSFPSKLIDYLGAALPVIVFAPSDLPAVQTTKEKDVGPSIDKNSVDAIRRVIDFLLEIPDSTYLAWSTNSSRWANEFLYSPKLLNEFFKTAKDEN